MQFYRRAYKLENLYLAKLGITIMTPEEEDTTFVLERETTNLNREGLGIYEVYTEVLTEIQVSVRKGNFSNLQTELPPRIKELIPFPKEYCTELELSTGLISDLRVYQIARQVNLNRDFTRN